MKIKWWLLASICFFFACTFGCASSSLKSKLVEFNLNLVRPYSFDLEKQHLSVPYVAKYTTSEKLLLYIASEHISAKDYPDLEQHPTLKTIREVFSDYKPQVVIAEGFDTGEELSPPSLFKYGDKCEAAHYLGSCGESIFAVNQARKAKAEFISGEPTHIELLKELLTQGYSTEDVLGFYLVRQIPEIKRENEFSKKTFPKKAQEELNDFQKMIGTKIKFTFQDFKAWYKQHKNKPENFMDVEANDTAPEGGPTATYVQLISSRVGIIRDLGVLKTIQAMLNRFDRVLVVYGGSHLLTQGPVLEDALGNPQFTTLEYQNVDQDLKFYDDFIGKMKATFEIVPSKPNDKEWVKSDLKYMYDIDQFMRKYFMNIPSEHNYSEKDKEYFKNNFLTRFVSLDQENTRQLKSLLKIYSWFKISEFGADADSKAWLLVQHADQDPEFQKEMLVLLGNLLPLHETNSRNYAYLYDRVLSSVKDISKRKLQRYGTQGHCVSVGVWEPDPVEDPTHLDERRKEMGLDSEADYIKIFKTEKICR